MTLVFVVIITAAAAAADRASAAAPRYKLAFAEKIQTVIGNSNITIESDHQRFFVHFVASLYFTVGRWTLYIARRLYIQRRVNRQICVTS